MNESESPITRRRLIGDVTRYMALGGIGLLSAGLVYKRSALVSAACPSPEGTCSDCSQAAGCRLPQVWQTRSQSLHRMWPMPDELRARPVGGQGGELVRDVRLLRQVYGLLPR